MDKEGQIQKAIAAIRSKEITSVREAARLFRVPRSTLQHRLAGAKSHAEAMEPYQRLTAAEEASIVRVALQMQVWGWPLTIQAIETFANHYLKAKNDDTPLGRHWYSNFLTCVSSLTDNQALQAINEGFLQGQQKTRLKKTNRKSFSTAEMLTVANISIVTGQSRLYNIRGVTRDGSTQDAQRLRKHGVEVIGAGLDDPSALAVAFDSADIIFAVTTMYDEAMEREAAQVKVIP
ncbi:hypothetical protein CHU98_g10934 [Xylaria longipes]|nr:hypothetical protein CHU98_g10934 [Xylaria longipes]